MSSELPFERRSACKLVSIRTLLALLERLGPVRGARTLRQILARALPTRSELEEVVYDLIIAGGFEPPEVNEPLRLEGRTVIPDFRWPEQKLVIEADGARWHDNALARARRRRAPSSARAPRRDSPSDPLGRGNPRNQERREALGSKRRQRHFL